jgi:hypothetical protein
MKYWVAFVLGFALILALSWCAHAEDYMVASYGVEAHHCAPPRITAHHRHQSRERRAVAGMKAAPRRFAAVPLPRPNPLDASRPTYEVEAYLLKFMMFGTLAHVR